MAAKKDEKIKRIPITLNLANKEDRDVYEILSKKGNRNYYIRQAVLYFHKGQRLDLRTAEDIKSVVAEAIRENMACIASAQNTENLKREDTKAVREDTKEPEEPAPVEEPEPAEDDILDLTGIEDLF